MTNTLYISTTPRCIRVLQTQLMLHFVPFMPMPFLIRVSGLGKQSKERESCVSVGKKNKTKESLPWSLCQSHQPQKFNALSPYTV